MSTAIACSLGLAGAASATEFDGRYLGNVFHSEYAGQSTDHTSHLYDIIMRQDTPRALRFDLGAALRYDSEFSYDSDLFRARAFGEVGNQLWRLHGQFVPWQRVQPTAAIPSRRDLQLGLDLTPTRAPQLFLNYTRADRRSRNGESGSDDLRANATYAYGNVGAHAGVRRLQTETIGFEAASRTDELTAGLQGSQSFRTFALSGAYDAVVTRIRQRERRLDQDTQRAAGDASWTPHPKVNLSMNGLYRWGLTSDNAQPRDTDIGETSLGGRLAYLPVSGLALTASRAYYKSVAVGGNQISDYMRLEALYQHHFLAQTNFQTGFTQTIDINSQGGGVPNSAVYLTIDGNLRQNFWARAESRAAKDPLADSGLQWYFALDGRTRPSRNTTFDVLWNRYSLPEVEGLQQRERTWELKAGYTPRAGANLTGSYRRLDGEGRVERAETIWSGNGSWRVRDDAVLSLYGSTRDTDELGFAAQEDVLGVDLTLQPRELLQVRGTWKYARRSSPARPAEDGFRNATDSRDTSYGVILTRTF